MAIKSGGGDQGIAKLERHCWSPDDRCGQAELTEGKPVRVDLRAAKKSLPVVAALASGTTAARKLPTLYLDSDPLEDS